ncbi:MAG: NUDIX hydrolase [Anaerolineae bacterium]|nr:NUDIX hydrolase [Anaerolineae bacterium]
MKREYPEAPIVGVGAVIRDGPRILLIRRNREPGKGHWTFPGGAVELGETVRDAVYREALEETGLQVEAGEMIVAIDRVLRDEAGRIQYHYVILDFLARPVGGTLRPGDDASDARWASLDELDELDLNQEAKEIAQKVLGGGE